ncbi:MAG TPA: hypothetical protein ENK02_08680 [Planctomycetes bacterium]|nr:hypothetical protein [Planctomycetota bacterium]
MKKQLFLLLVPCLLSLTTGLEAQAPQGRNEKTFYNTNHTSATVRDGGGTVDTLYFMQPPEAHTGYGKVSGFRIVLQDQDQSTAETINLALVRFAGTTGKPDTSAGGVVAGSSMNFKLFGSGSGSAAYSYTLTLGTPVVAPAQFGIRLTLPIPRGTWPQDGVTVHYQAGTNLKLGSATPKPQWTYKKASNGSAQAFGPAGSTFRLGVLLDQPVLQFFNESSAYGSNEKLFGPESLFPLVSRSDKTGFRLAGDRFGGGFGIILISGSKAATPLSTPFGTVFPTLAGSLYLPAVPLDKQGKATTPSLTLPPKTTIWAQAAFLQVKPFHLSFSDAARVKAQ